MQIHPVAIPNRFYVAGIPVNVVKMSGFHALSGKLAKVDYQQQEIVLDTTELKRESLEQAYIQNLLRYCLYAMSEHGLREDDKFTDSLAHLLHQALTMREE